MRIGVDVNGNCIDGALIDHDTIIETLHIPVNTVVRTKKEMTDGIVTVMEKLNRTGVNGIGLSLPTRIDTDKGTVFELSLIPHWKGKQIKQRLQDRYGIPVTIDADINCCVLAEINQGQGKHYSDILYITMQPEICVGILANNGTIMDFKTLTDQVKCLSKVMFNPVRYYKESFNRTIDEINDLTRISNKITNKSGKEMICKTMVPLITRLTSILLSNYQPQLIIFGGSLSENFNLLSVAVKEILEQLGPIRKIKYVPSELVMSRAVGAAYLIKYN